MNSNNTMTPLSPAARETYDAFNRVCLYNEPSFETDRKALGAALRAAADLVTPENYKCFTGTSDWDLGSEARNDAIRDELLAIAAELEGANG